MDQVQCLLCKQKALSGPTKKINYFKGNWWNFTDAMNKNGGYIQHADLSYL
jgi:hypothetical protein